MCCPAGGDEAEDPGHDEGDSSRDAHLGFDRWVLHAVGAIPSSDREQDSNDPHHDGDDDEGPGSLEVRAEGQHGIVDLTLHLACTLNNTVHPNPFPHGLRGDNVAPDKGADFPHGKGTSDNSADPAQDPQGCTEHL